MQESADFSIRQARANEELDAACRSTQPEEAELHLRLALLYLQQQKDALHFAGCLPAPSHRRKRPEIYHTDKEA